MTKPNNMVVQGKQVNASVIAAYAKRLGSIDEVISVWANAAALQLAMHGNRNWLDSLFESKPLRMKNGALSKLGAETLSYLKAFYPCVKFNAETQQLGWKKPAKDSILTTHFADPTITEENKGSAGDEVTEFRGKFYRDHGDFALTLSQWRDFQSAGSEGEEDEIPTLTAAKFIKQASAAIEALNGKRFVGSAEELATAMEKAGSLFDMIKALAVAALPEVESIDADAAAKLLQSGQKGKSARAGGKVETAETKAVV